jgi:hypothetical protein
MSSIYLTTVSELAKKNGQPTAEFVAKLREVGFELPANAAHLKKLTAEDLNTIASLLNPGQATEAPARAEDFVIPHCASIVITPVGEREYIVSAVQTSLVNGNIILKELERFAVCRSKAEAILESDRAEYKYGCSRT